MHNVPQQSMWPCISYPCLVTKVFVKGAKDLEKQDRFGSNTIILFSYTSAIL